TVGDSRHVLRRRRVLYSADEDFDRILVSLNTDQVEGVTHDTDRAGLAASGNPWPHHIIDQSLHDIDRGLPETLVLVTTAGVWKENGTSRDVALQSWILCLDARGGPHTEDLDLGNFLEFFAHTYPSVYRRGFDSLLRFNRSRGERFFLRDVLVF